MEASTRIEIRRAKLDDLETIVQLLAQDSLLSRSDDAAAAPGQVEAFHTIAAHSDNELIVAALGDEVVGTLQLTFIPGLSSRGMWRAQVEGVRVRGDLRGHGIGAQMMEWVISRARARNCWMIQLTTNQTRVDAHRFYARLGFKASHVGMKLYL